MRSFWALVRREYLEHRGAFLYAPLILIGIVSFLVASALVTGRYRVYMPVSAAAPRLFEVGYFGIAALWWGYCFVALFFYFADAFNADRRNNQMLFWKSMPQRDFKILLSKLVAGVTVLPALIYLALLLTGLIAVGILIAMPYVVPALGAPDIPGTLLGWGQISAVALCYLVLALLWYAPFFAWVGALSTVVGRWSIPLALLIPVVISLFEGVLDFGSAPGGSYILTFLRQRLSFNFDTGDLQQIMFSAGPVDLPAVLGRLVVGVDWPLLLGGLVFAVLVVYLASEYRRRWVLKG
jgi:ABC-2 type transport system permease protein